MSEIDNILRKISAKIIYTREEPPSPGRMMDIPKGLDNALYMLTKLKHRGGLYSHQHNSIELSLAGRNVAINTSTASGKSLCFILPVINELVKSPTARSLFIFPIKALSNDQIKKLQEWFGALRLREVVQKYDGDVKGEERLKAIKNGRLLVATPDVLNTSLLRLNKEEYYKDFFANLRYVVLDECHIYSGAFGSHMAMLIRRLRQVCKNHHNSPQFILSSATIGSPGEHVKALTGLDDINLIGEADNGSPVAGKKYYLVNIPEENKLSTFILKLTRSFIQAGKQFLIFCNTRKEVENLTMHFKQSFPEILDRIMPYRAGYEAEDRAAIEDALSNGKLAGLFCTSALEMGIDLPHLDVCVMSGLPGNKISMVQRAGRVGRKTPGAVIICAGDSPYDDYYFNHPRELFERQMEDLVISLGNKQILIDHFACARAEALHYDEPNFDENIFGREFMQIANHVNLYDCPDDILYDQAPHFKVQIRCVDDPTYNIVHGQHSNDPPIGQITYSQILREAYKSAIYLHMGKRYRVKKISYTDHKIYVDSRCPMASTRPKTEVFVRPRPTSRAVKSKVWPGLKVWETGLSITEKITGYTETINKKKTEVSYLQPMIRYFVTNGTVISLSGLHNITHGAVMGLASALENAYPIVYHCSKDDIGAYAWSKENHEAQIYLFDSTAGGLGITSKVVGLFEKLLEVANQTISHCPNCSVNEDTADYGCYKCVISNSWFNYANNTRKDTLKLINELITLIGTHLPVENEIREDLNLKNQASYRQGDRCFGRTMLASGSLVYTGKHQEGIVLDSEAFYNGIIEDRLYRIQIGDQMSKYLGNRLTLIQGKVERWCVNCGQELIDLEEEYCPICGVLLK
ncbi:MAG: DEAD/DEAH box helicase [Desulfotomaculaceae bacterium]|nr:DEAD/DEAH box helicase [Desulfotomaculaceae bacterium]